MEAFLQLLLSPVVSHLIGAAGMIRLVVRSPRMKAQVLEEFRKEEKQKFSLKRCIKKLVKWLIVAAWCAIVPLGFVISGFIILGVTANLIRQELDELGYFNGKPQNPKE